MTRCPASWRLVRPAASPTAVCRAGATAARAHAVVADAPPASAIPRPASACRRVNPLRGRPAEPGKDIGVSLPSRPEGAEHDGDFPGHSLPIPRRPQGVVKDAHVLTAARLAAVTPV